MKKRTTILLFQEETVYLEQKRINNFYLRVSADGMIYASAPLVASAAEVERFLSAHWNWAMEKKEKRKNLSQTQRQYRTGEYLKLWGKEYPLVVRTVTARTPVAHCQGNKILLFAAVGSTIEVRQAAYHTLLKGELLRAAEKLIPKCEQIVGKCAKEYRIRSMKTRWGTCNIRTYRVWLNLHLAKQPLSALEYVLIHELTHLWEASHGARFKMYMDEFYPTWRSVQKELNRNQDFS